MLNFHLIRNTGIATLILYHICLSVCAVNLIENGGFSNADDAGIPVKWNFKPDSRTAITMKTVRGGYDSSHALEIKSKNLFGTGRGPLRQFLPLKDKREYLLSCHAQGEAGGYLSFALGNHWRQRLWIRGGKEWTEYALPFICQEKEMAWKDHYEICLLTESVCNAKVTNVCLRPLNALYGLDLPYSKADKLYVVAPTMDFSLKKIAIPATLPLISLELMNEPGQGLGSGSIVKSANDLSCNAALAYDDKGLVFYARVRDDKHFANGGTNMWNADCVQLGIAQQNILADERGSGDHEIGFALVNGKPENYCWTLKRPLRPDEMEYTVQTLPEGYLVVARISWTLLNQIDRNNNGQFSINIVVNDTDDGVQRKALSFAPGMYSFKSNKENLVCLLQDKNTPVIFNSSLDSIMDVFTGKLIITGQAQAETYAVQITGSDGKKIKIPIPCDRPAVNNLPLCADLRLDTSHLPAGTISFAIVSGNKIRAEIKLDKKDFFQKFTGEFTAIKKEYSVLRNKIKELERQHQTAARLKVALAIAEQQIALLEQDMKLSNRPEEKNYNGERGLRICDELRMLFRTMEKDITDMKTGIPAPESYQYQSSPRVLQDGYFESVVIDAAGKKSTRPVIFSGYGHFGRVLKDIEWFPNIGVNFIQTEIGPKSVIKGENDDGSFIIDEEAINAKSKVLERAWKNNIAVTLLISPHYFPEWALEKHPEVAWNSGSFLRFEVQHPYARKLIETYIKTLLSLLRKSPGADAIHSICISNEPSYHPSLRNKLIYNRFIDYLKKQYHGNVGELNRAWGSSFSSFAAAVPDSDPLSDAEFKGLYYDFNMFRMDEFARWHDWMASLVKELWPGMPVHAKQLGGFGLDHATDFERFSRFSDVNGCDTGENIYLALMASFKPVHIVNSENHMIADGEQKPVAYDKIYADMMRQFVYGMGGSAVWVWEAYGYGMFKQKHALDGNIYRRPMNILAVYDASADAERLVYELRDAFNVKPEVAILYSTSSMILSPTYQNDCINLWNALSLTGRKVGFVSEDLLQTGNIDGVKILLAANNTAIQNDTAKALNLFVRQGGKLFSLGNSFQKNQYGRPLPEQVTISTHLPDKDLNAPEKCAAMLTPQLDSVLGALPLTVEMENRNNSTLEWRCTPRKNGGSLVYMLNAGKDKVDVKLSCASYNLITRQPQSAKFTLPPFQPLLLQIEK